MKKDENKINLKLKMNSKNDSISPMIQNLLNKIENIDHEVEDLKFRLEMAAREMLANAVEHGCRQKEGEIEIELTVTSSEVTLKVQDPGSGFDWKNANFTMPLLTEKGRGLGMIDKAVDEIQFNESGNMIKVYFWAG